jgi:prophage DNA circulation protein
MATGVVKIDGFVLEVEEIKDGFSKSIAKHEFPFRNGALLEDLGQKARTVAFTAHFYGDSYSRHIDFLNHLGNQELFELIHPVYGPMSGCVEKALAVHNDQVRHAAIDIEFVEQYRAIAGQAAQLEVRPDVVSRVESQVDRTLSLAADKFALDVRSDFGSLGIPATEAASLAEVPILPEASILSQMPSLSSPALGYVVAVDAAVGRLEALMSAVAQPANSLIGTIDFGLTLPGRVIGTCARVVERYARALDSVRTAPARFLDLLGRELSGLSAEIESLPAAAGVAGSSGIATVIRHLSLVSATVFALEAATAYSEDESRRAESKQAEEADTFDMLGYYHGSEAPEPVMTLPELEDSLATVRTALQAAVVANRDIAVLKQIAASLLEHVNRVKLEREKIAPFTLDNATPVHLLCLRHGLPRNAADRVLAINRIPAPNFAQGTVNVYVR